MTLEELRMRIGVVFPDAEEEVFPRIGQSVFTFGKGRWVWWFQGGSWEAMANTAELERRIVDSILSVTAHDIIAARRRFALDELARLDADLIVDEPPAPDLSDAH